MILYKTDKNYSGKIDKCPHFLYKHADATRTLQWTFFLQNFFVMYLRLLLRNACTHLELSCQGMLSGSRLPCQFLDTFGIARLTQ